MKVFIIFLLICLGIPTGLHDSFASPPNPEIMKQYYDRLEQIRQMEVKPSPQSQVNSGIKFDDVVCNDGLVLILRWDTTGSICVSQHTSQKLEERMWGVPIQKTAVFGNICTLEIAIQLKDTPVYEKSVIRLIRDIIQTTYTEGSDKQYIYHIIKTTGTNSGNIGIFISDLYMYNGSQGNLIPALNENEYVSKVSEGGKICY